MSQTKKLQGADSEIQEPEVSKTLAEAFRGAKVRYTTTGTPYNGLVPVTVVLDATCRAEDLEVLQALLAATLGGG